MSPSPNSKTSGRIDLGGYSLTFSPPASLAKNLYTSKARFVFELLQITEDSTYSTAKAAGDDPFVSFRLYRDRLVVDYNEDGFTEANLTAICDVGRSSNTTSQGYIGEKGIGFVFMAAWKVHIQFGRLSSSFARRKGDSGMGMVRPRWEAAVGALPQSRHTRITLSLEDQARRDLDAHLCSSVQPEGRAGYGGTYHV